MNSGLYWLLAALLGATLFWPLMRVGTRDRGSDWDYAAPERLVAVLLGLRVVPFFVRAAIIGIEPALNEWVRDSPLLADPDTAAIEFAILQVTGYLALIAGIRAIPRRSLPNPPGMRARRSWLLPGLAFTVCGFVAFGIFLSKVGPFSYVIAHLAERSGVQAGQGYLTHLFVSLLTSGAIIVLLAAAARGSFSGYAIAATVFVASAVAITATGGRSFVVQLVFLAIIAWHYTVRRISRVRGSYLLIGAVVSLYIVALPVLRTPGGYDLMVEEPSNFIRQVVENAPEISSGNAYVDTQLFIVARFSPDNVWAGRSYLGLLAAPIPRTIYPGKPPVDDGVYVFSLVQGIQVTPPAPLTELTQSAWPPSTFGAMYMNFWIPGVLIGMFVLGLTYGAAYRAMIRSGFGLVAVLAYGITMWRFQLSSLNIVLTLLYLALLVPVSLALRMGVRKDDRHAVGERSVHSGQQ